MLGFYLNICNRIYECYKISKTSLFCDGVEEKGSIKMVDWGSVRHVQSPGLKPSTAALRKLEAGRSEAHAIFSYP